MQTVPVLDARVAAVEIDTGVDSASAVSWAAILAGAGAAAALSLILLSLGAGLGLSAVSPWSYAGASAKAIGVGAIIWLLLTSLAASGLGGYIAGRLRTRWLDADTDESHFRDSAHGFLAWAVATIVSAALLASASTSMIGITAMAGSAVAGSAATGAAASAAGTATTASSGERNATGGGSYFADMLFRSDKPATPEATSGAREAGVILANAASADMSQADRTYLAQLVSSRTGLSPADAEQRVTQTLAAQKAALEAAATKAREAAETARKITMRLALWVFASLLVGAFYAALMATWGGRQRDAVSRPA